MASDDDDTRDRSYKAAMAKQAMKMFVPTALRRGMHQWYDKAGFLRSNRLFPASRLPFLFIEAALLL